MALVPVFRRELPPPTDGTKGFVVERKEHHKYMSHPRGSEFPIPVWELSNEMITSLREKYVIGEDKSPEDVILLLKTSLENNLDSIASKQGFTFKVPKSEMNLMEYNETTCISLLSCGDDDYVNRSFNDGRTRHTATKTAWAAQKLCVNFDAGVSMTKRDLMYENRELFKDQDGSDRTLRDMCFIYRCRMPSLKVLPLQKGLVLGNIILKLRSGLEINCSEGAQIPNDIRKIEDIVLIDGAETIQYVLVVEKYTMQHYLEQMNFHNQHNCIIITGCGMAGLTTREFLHLLKKITKLPLYGLCDPDPEGAAILATYARGSIDSSYDNFNVAVPTLHWIGIWISQLKAFGIPQECFRTFKDKDHSKLDYLLNDKSMKLSEGWLEKVKEMKESGLKASFEDLKYLGVSFFADELLPQLINNAATT